MYITVFFMCPQKFKIGFSTKIVKGEYIKHEPFTLRGIFMIFNAKKYGMWIKVLKMGRKHGLSVKIQLDLFDKMVKPILLYGCEVWGFSNNDIIEKKYNKIL